MTLVRVSRHRGEVAGVPFGEEPRVDLDLRPNDYVIAFELRPIPARSPSTTVDWLWTAHVATPVASSHPADVADVQAAREAAA